ncbi:MAG: hypothetical protein DI626_07545 [Micavibrio aeruginosavorus]|uniref:Uncharacterized protein n=1 Tax=Micavibrio aeruginosavorus TaxID=349221 RepID=A0A2W5BQ94_9BACT|nr:MAG: hypothetical protein DI626_07545 [Micavibrio aeruginosavorus]
MVVAMISYLLFVVAVISGRSGCRMAGPLGILAPVGHGGDPSALTRIVFAMPRKNARLTAFEKRAIRALINSI